MSAPRGSAATTATQSTATQPIGPAADADEVVADEVGADEVGADERKPGEAGSGGRRLVVVLVALTVLLAGAALVLAFLLRGYGTTDDARDAAVQAAKQSALNLTSVDATDFDADVARVVDGATGAFLADFQSRSADLKTILAENQVVSEGTVLEAGLVRSDARTATALVVVDSTVSNTAAPEGRMNTYRMQIELELVDGRWLTSMLEFVG